MAWLTTDKNGTETIWNQKPERDKVFGIWYGRPFIDLPKGTIKKIIGKKINWDNDPVEIKTNSDTMKKKLTNALVIVWVMLSLIFAIGEPESGSFGLADIIIKVVALASLGLSAYTWGKLN